MIKNIETVIIQILDAKKPTTERSVNTTRICLDDIRNEQQLTNALQQALLLKSLVGRTIDDVRWINIPDKETNPCGSIGHFAVVLRP